MKKISLLIVVIMILVFNTGCAKSTTSFSNSISISLVVTDKISQTMALPTCLESVKGEDKKNIEKFKTELMQNFTEKIFVPVYLTHWLKYLQFDNEKYKLNGKNINFTTPKFSHDDSKIYFTLNFLTYDAWAFYNSSNQIKTTSKSDFKFINKTKNQSVFPFSAKTNNSVVGYQYKSVLESIFEKNFSETTLPKINYVYEYSSTQKNLKSNADIVQSQAGLQSHFWVVEENVLEKEKPIEMWINHANPSLWYLTALSFCFLCVGVSFGICFLVRKKKNKRKAI